MVTSGGGAGAAAAPTGVLSKMSCRRCITSARSGSDSFGGLALYMTSTQSQLRSGSSCMMDCAYEPALMTVYAITVSFCTTSGPTCHTTKMCKLKQHGGLHTATQVQACAAARQGSAAIPLLPALVWGRRR